MNAQTTHQPCLPSREVKFTIVPALAAAGFCAAVAFLTVQLLGVAMGLAFAIRTIAGIHFALATGIVFGFSTVMFAMDDKDDQQVISLPTGGTSRPRDGTPPTNKRAA